jgi:hypothetical protein
MRDFITAASLGVVTKLYDDLTDNSIISDGVVKEGLFSLLCFLVGAVSYNDFTFSSIFYSANIFAFLGGPESYESTKEKSLLYSFPFIVLLSLFSFSSISYIEVLLLLFAIIVIFVEAIVIKEDVSLRKLIIRVVLSIILSATIAGGLTVLPISKSFLKLLFFGLAYLSTSIVYQIYSLKEEWSVPVNSEEVINLPEKIEIHSENTEQEKVLDSQQEQV